MQENLSVRSGRSNQQIQALVREFERSGLTHERFARKKGIGVSTLYAYRRKLQAEGQSANRLMEVKVAPPIQTHPSSEGYRIELSNGISLQVPRGFSAWEVQQLIDLTAQAS